MKYKYLIFILGIIMALAGLVTSLVSAVSPSVYYYIFAISIFCELIALGCLCYLLCIGDRWWVAVLLPGIIVIYTIADVALRFFLGMRILDLFGR